MDELNKLQKDHFRAIESSDAIYVINPDGYIGTMVTAEIGYALGKNKPVFYSEETGRTELDALTSGINLLWHRSTPKNRVTHEKKFNYWISFISNCN